LLMTVIACDSQMGASKMKSRLAMLTKAECRGHKLQDSVAAVAMIQVGNPDKLAGVLIGMTVGAVAELYCEDRCFAPW